MSNNSIEAHKITKPIQLLAAWLVGLAIIDVSFLTAAAKITQPDWIPALLSIASVVNVPIFVVSIFLLQTKFRPEMQEDAYYSDYLNRKNSNSSAKSADASSDSNNTAEIESKIEVLTNKITQIAAERPDDLSEKIKTLISDEHIEELSRLHHGSRTISELYIRPEYWANVVDEWKHDPVFQEDIDEAIEAGLVTLPSGSIKLAALTEVGKKVAELCERKKTLFSQENSKFFYGYGKSKGKNV